MAHAHADDDESYIHDDDENWGPKGHLSELMRLQSRSFWHGTFLEHAKESTPVALLRFATHGLWNFGVSLILSPTSIVGDPLSSFASLVIYPIIFVGLFLLAVVFWIGSHLGGAYIVGVLSRRYADGFSAPNWLDPTIFSDENNAIIASAKTFLEGTPSTIPHPIDSSHQRSPRAPATTRVFSLPVARTFLLMSAIVYERKDDLVKQAAKLVESDPAESRRLYNLAHKRIKKQAKQWDLHYEAISSMSSVAGPFASVFFPRKAIGNLPYIALVFKGTSAASFSEILVDANITRVPASVFYGAGSTCHEGFYDDLFPSNSGGSDAYSTIRSYVKALAAEMRPDKTTARIPLWVTGHSLGSALASLIFARFLQSPDDLGVDIDLRDCYCYGTPRLGDGAFAASFERNSVTPIDRPSILWRVVNNMDIVCQVPPGLADNDHSRGTLGLSVLNYSHIGTHVQLNPIITPFFSINNSYFRTTTHSVLSDTRRPKRAGERQSSRFKSLTNAGWNPVRLAICLLPSPLYDHFPASYLGHLDQIDINKQVAPSEEDAHIITSGSHDGVLNKAKARGHWQ